MKKSKIQFDEIFVKEFEEYIKVENFDILNKMLEQNNEKGIPNKRITMFKGKSNIDSIFRDFVNKKMKKDGEK